ncbi:MAG TPA: ATP-binding protein [Chitinophagaceae bacterium]|nr:ATP-binding protein [Chitinophagaceae bacterium]
MPDSINDIPCIYFSSSADGFILQASDSLCQCLGYTRDELVGRKLESIFTLSTRIFQQTHFYPLLQLNGQAEELYITLRSKDGADIPMLTNATQTERNGNIIIQFAGITLTKRKKFEDEIIAAKKAAERALNENTSLKAAQEELQKRAEELDNQIGLTEQQNRELRQFNHVATHTLQEPLRKLLLFSSQILETGEHKASETSVQKIRRTVEDMNAKLKGLQQYVWLTNEEFEWDNVDLLVLTEQARQQVELENPDVTIELQTEAIPRIRANSKQMQFLLKELLLNAIRFRKPGNIADVKMYASTLLLNKFRQLPGKYRYTEILKLEIRDNGIGFDDKYGDQAFELFRKLHLTDGQGVGLSLCKKIVENHGGSISIESQKDVGTTVIILLPLAREIHTPKPELV